MRLEITHTLPWPTIGVNVDVDHHFYTHDNFNDKSIVKRKIFFCILLSTSSLNIITHVL